MNNSSIGSVELQQALYTLLSTGKYPVFEVVPKDKHYPYINIRIQSKNSEFTKTDTNRYTYFVYIHSWSKGTSSMESKIMDNFIEQSVMGLDSKAVAGFNVDMVKFGFGETLTEVEIGTNIFQGIQQYEITLSEEKGVV